MSHGSFAHIYYPPNWQSRLVRAREATTTSLGSPVKLAQHWFERITAAAERAKDDEKPVLVEQIFAYSQRSAIPGSIAASPDVAISAMKTLEALLGEYAAKEGFTRVQIGEPTFQLPAEGRFNVPTTTSANVMVVF
jgi:hypothetical protein